MLHNARYDFNDGNLEIGAQYWTRLVETWLSGEGAARRTSEEPPAG